jgi:5,10-methylenetetrahydromethanopterin reductase
VTHFSISVVAAEPDTTIASARAAEAAGFDLVYTADIQSTHREVYTHLTLTATATERVLIGPGVTNPVTRHPAVTAGAIASLDEISGGRAFLGLGTGDSAVRNLGLKEATRKRTAEYLAAVRAYHETGRATWDGVEGAGRRWDRRIPVIYSAHGPKNLHQAGRIADGVVAGVGITPDAVDYVREHVAAGAAEAGRDPSEIDLWFMAYPSLADSEGEARTAVAAALAAGGNLLARGPALATVPDRFRQPLRDLAADYTYTQHMNNEGHESNGALASRLGLIDYLADRFSLAGTAADVREQIRTHDKQGVEHFWLIDGRPGLSGFLDVWGREIVRPLAS